MSLSCATREKLSQSLPLRQEKPIRGIKLSSAETPGAPAGCWKSIDSDKLAELGIVAGGGQMWGQAAGRHRLVCPLLPATRGNPKLWAETPDEAHVIAQEEKKVITKAGSRGEAGVYVLVTEGVIADLASHFVGWRAWSSPAALLGSAHRLGQAGWSAPSLGVPRAQTCPRRPGNLQNATSLK